jgi:lipopolysaccharide export system ATP-binding protein
VTKKHRQQAATAATPTQAPGPVLVRTEKLVKAFKRRTVVREVSVTLHAGEVVGLLGPNGAGKTTTFSMIVGLLRPDSGRIFFEDKDVTRLPMYRRARSGMAYLPQEASVFRQLTVRQNLQIILEHQPLGRADRHARIEALLDDLRIRHVADSPAYTLSGGERRRTEIARALAIQPKVFLLDEPFAGIDPIAVHDLQQTVRDLTRRGIGVLITDHNVRETLGIADRAYIISEGAVIKAGTPGEIAADPAVREVYLGEHFELNAPGK